jgi:flavodoxin
MEVLIVYQSLFGNTEKVAAAIGDSLGSRKNTSKDGGFYGR